jgi:hypothetical protein
VLRRYSQYNETGFSQFVLNDAARRGLPRARTPLDGNTLHLRMVSGGEHDSALDFNGQVLFKPASGGVIGTAVVQGGYTGAEFEILGAGHTRTPGFDGVSLYADTLNRLNAGRLTIGGTPTVYYGSEGGSIKVIGNTSAIRLREGAILSAPEVVLSSNSANGGITIDAGAGVNTLGRGNVPYDAAAGFVYEPGRSSLLVAEAFVSATVRRPIAPLRRCCTPTAASSPPQTKTSNWAKACALALANSGFRSVWSMPAVRKHWPQPAAAHPRA